MAGELAHVSLDTAIRFAALAFSPDGQRSIALSAAEPDIRIWDPRTGKEVREKIAGKGNLRPFPGFHP